MAKSEAAEQLGLYTPKDDKQQGQEGRGSAEAGAAEKLGLYRSKTDKQRVGRSRWCRAARAVYAED